MKTLRIRLRDKHASQLDVMAREVNMVWNFVNELSAKHTQRTGKFFCGRDLQKYTNGATKEGLQIHSQTVQAICDEYATRRRQFKKRRLAWRVSRGARKSLGWIPFKVGAVQYHQGQLRYAGKFIGMRDSYGLGGYELRAGSFSQDARGRWYANVCVETKPQTKTNATATAIIEREVPSVGIDLGIKEFAAFSDATQSVASERFYRDMEAALAVAQRAKKKQRTRAIHAKIAHRRKDFLHKLSTVLVKKNGAIFVGNVNASGLAKTKMAKSVLDAGWSTFRTMLQYKCDDAGVWFEEVNEAYSTQTCSACKSRTGPKGLEGLGIRGWTCIDCGTENHRDRNAAKNILAAGHRRLAEGIPGLAC
jgi:putative transposase